MIDLGDAVQVGVGARGRPGEREFFVQVVTGEGVRCFLVEKFQVAALAMEAAQLLRSAGASGSGERLEGGLVDATLDAEFRVGGIELGVFEGGNGFAVGLTPVGDGGEGVRFGLSGAQLDAVAREGALAVQAGRERCERCGLAIDPGGHHCPSTNGDLRNHRP